MEGHAWKESFRRKAVAALRRVPRCRARQEDRMLRELLRRRILQRRPRRVLLYLPLPLEVDLRPLIRELRKKGIEVYVPFMEGESFRPVKYRLPLRRKRFGIYEPKISRQYRPRKIDIAVVPIVGIDPSGRRIGFGKGFYDRFFAKEKQNIEEIIFIQRRLCRSPRIITGRHDVRGDLLISGRESHLA